MRQKVTMMVALTGLMVLLIACKMDMKVLDDGGPKVSENRKHGGFDRIEVTGWPTVVYTQGDSCSVTVEGPENQIGQIVTEVKGGTLVVRNKGKYGVLNINMIDGKGIVVYATSPDLTGVTVTGSGDFISRQRVDTDNLDISLRGSGDISFEDIICDHCTTTLVGSGDIDLKRLEALTSTVTLTGSGDVDIKQYGVEQTDVKLTGSGDIDIDFLEGCQRVDCRLAGSGDIDLKGTVRTLSRQKGGSGDIDTSKLNVTDRR